MTGFISPGLSAVFNELYDTLFALFSPATLGALPAITDTLLRGIVNTALDKELDKQRAQPACPGRVHTAVLG